jgi:hypothetical protein
VPVLARVAVAATGVVVAGTVAETAVALGAAGLTVAGIGSATPQATSKGMAVRITRSVPVSERFIG